jgi:hypothetical protein
VGGYSRRVSPDVVFVADFVRARERDAGHDSNLFEAGVRVQLTPLFLVGAGLGAGVGEEAPDVRLTLSLQHSF